MPNIRPSTDLRNNYNEISNFCHESSQPVFITKNGKGDLAVMSMEEYDRLSGMNELYALIAEGMNDIENGRVISSDDFFRDLRGELTKDV